MAPEPSGPHSEPPRVLLLLLALTREPGGLQGVSARKGRPRTTRRRKGGRPTSDLVERQFEAPGPDRLWVPDIIASSTDQ